MRKDPLLRANRPRHATRMRAAATALAVITLALASGCGKTSGSPGSPPSGSGSPLSTTKLIAIFTHDGGDVHNWRGTFSDADQNQTDFDSVSANPVTIKALGGTMVASGTSVGEWTMTFDPSIPFDQIVAVPEPKDQDTVTLEAGSGGTVLVHVRDAGNEPANLSFTLESNR